MRIEKLKKKFSFTDENLKKIQEAVANAEKNTDGEIALAVTPSSNSYAFWELLFAVVMGLITSACLIPFSSKIKSFLDWLYWDTNDYHFSFWLLFTVFVAILIFYLLANIPFIDRLIVPKKVRNRSVYNKAIRIFVHSGVYKTKSNTGILLFFSIFERKIQIIADDGIASKIPHETWKNLANSLAEGFKSKNPTETIIKAVEECGEILAKEFPCQKENPNELPDGLVILGGGE
jgi:putative membrane protein